MISSRTVLALVVAPFVLVACVGTSADEAGKTEAPIVPAEKDAAAKHAPAQEVAVDVCAHECARFAQCDSANDRDTCEARCENTNGVFLSKVNADFTRELSACIDEAACRLLESGSALSDCTAQARARLAPSPSATKFCDDYASAFQHCGGTVDKAKCYLDAKIYDDDALAAAAVCLSKTCADVQSCVLASLGIETATPTPQDPPAPTCSAKLSYSDAQCGSCMGSSCCAADNACASEPTFGAYYDCVSACTTTACESACGSSYPKGKAAFDALASCMNDRCATSCQ